LLTVVNMVALACPRRSGRIGQVEQVTPLHVWEP